MRPGRAGTRVRHAGLCGFRGRPAHACALFRARAPTATPQLRCALRLEGVPVFRRLPCARRGGAGVRRGLWRGAGLGPQSGFRSPQDLPSRQRQDRAPSIAEYIEAIVDAVHLSLGREKRLLLEPGRALVANSTATIYTVQTVKHNVSTWVAVDGGMSDNLRPMLYGSEYDAVIADRPLATPTERCQIAGKHCESGDVIVRDVALADPVAGDVIVTPVTGAYGY